MEGPGRELCFLCTSRYVAITVISTLGSLDSLNCGERNSNYFFHYLCYISSRLPRTQTLFKSDCHFFFFFLTRAVSLQDLLHKHTPKLFFLLFFHSDPVNTKQRRDGSLSTPDVILVKRDLMRKRSWPSLLPRLFHSLTARERTNWEKTKRRPGLISTAVMDPLQLKLRMQCKQVKGLQRCHITTLHKLPKKKHTAA